MKNPHRVIAVLSLLLLMGTLSGCSILGGRGASATRDHAFIAYSPVPETSGRLRLAVKDNIDVKGVVTTAGSEYLAKNSPPATRDAACLAIARQRGVRIVGKANLSEFAVSPSGVNEYFGTPKNPFSKWIRLVPGGSSSGSAAAVRNGQADVAFGTDTAGSVRTPAAWCGLVGLKTTFGLVPLDGVFPVEPWHLDTVGPIAKDIARTVQGMELLEKGFAAKYQAAVADHPAARKIRIGRLVLTGTDPAIDQAVDEALARAHFEVVPLGRDFQEAWDRAQTDGTTVAAAGAWMSDGKYLLQPDVGARSKAVIVLGRILYPVPYRAALERRAAWQHTLRDTFKKVDFIALPTVKSRPPAIPLFNDVAALEARIQNLQNTSAVNFAGNPALAMPIPVQHERIPVTSLQLIGPRLSEAALLNAGRLVEATSPVTPETKKTPKPNPQGKPPAI